MKFFNYINEASGISITQKLYKECTNYLQVALKCSPHKILYRGVAKDISIMDKIIPRVDRNPRDTKLYVHDKFNEKFLERFGWKARSEGVIVTSDKATANGYATAVNGKTYKFYPTDGYRFIWSPNVTDFFIMTRNLYPQSGRGHIKKLPDNTIKMFKTDCAYILSTMGKTNKIKLISDMDNTDDISDFTADIIVESYTDKDLCEAMVYGNEIMFKCDAYYLVNPIMAGPEAEV